MLLKTEDLMNLKLQTRNVKPVGSRPTLGQRVSVCIAKVVLGLQPPRPQGGNATCVNIAFPDTVWISEAKVIAW
jgi:hypothetical protein